MDGFYIVSLDSGMLLFSRPFLSPTTGEVPTQDMMQVASLLFALRKVSSIDKLAENSKKNESTMQHFQQVTDCSTKC
jgi:F420-dependent methylenetetrahydromethanopterin dehydrogenase